MGPTQLPFLVTAVTECVYCAVRNEFITVVQVNLRFQMVKRGREDCRTDGVVRSPERSPALKTLYLCNLVDCQVI